MPYWGFQHSSLWELLQRPSESKMAASVSTNEVASTLRRHNQQSQSKFAPVDSGAAQQVVLRDTNKRPRVASTSELETQHKKKTESSGMATSSPGQTAAVAYGTAHGCLYPTARFLVGKLSD